MNRHLTLIISLILTTLSAVATDYTTTVVNDSITALPTDSTRVILARDTITDPYFLLPQSFTDNLETQMEEWYLSAHTTYMPHTSHIVYDVNYPDSVYRNRLDAMCTLIDMPYNQVVRKSIDYYMRRGEWIETLLGRATLYMPIFEQALIEAGLPLELKYLPVIESALRPSVASGRKATGLWQFMLGTAKQYGLEVNSLVDERCDPYKSSVAAAAFLKDLYEIYGDWHLALAAYNCGPGRLSRIIRRTGQNDYWAIYYSLPRETAGYVPGFIAANYAMTYYNEHNINPVLVTEPLVTDTVMVNDRLYFDHIAQVLEVPVEMLRELNPQYLRDIIPGSSIKQYSLRLPTQQIFTYIELQDSIVSLAYERDMAEYGVAGDELQVVSQPIYHKVKKGETLSRIARKYGTTVKNIKNWNGIKSDRISIGQNLIVGWTNGVPPKKEDTPATTSSSGTYHKVKKGETLSTIAGKYGTTVSALKKANNLKSDKITVGQRLLIP